MSTTKADHYRQGNASPYCRKFELRDLGIDTDAFLQHIRPTYEMLQWDMYDTSRSDLQYPTRQRAIAEVVFEREGEEWNAQRMPAQPYVQTQDYGGFNRTEPRSYPEVSEKTTENPEFLKLKKSIADIVLSIRRDVKKLRMIFTFTRVVVDDRRKGFCALEEGIHSDGMDYIVSALVINRINLQPESGESSVHTLEQRELFRTVLQPGEGIFQDDRQLMHNITKIQREVQDKPGLRDILGIDILILS